ncbi:MAG: DUF1553 domain-containing protein, partial [Planctomycetia bacterium]|nr:DUF1553 domain-containing protein [Planctomycetia bacterium]
PLPKGGRGGVEKAPPGVESPPLSKGGHGGVGSSGRRLALARWIASAENQLTARVIVNRVWQFHFGRGIVRSPNNFGQLGDPPTHPELLDWLACDFVDSGWQLKRLHRQIMLSAAYQMSSRASEAGLKADPGNDLFWRYDMRRLSAEEIRDSVLAVSGKLNPKMYGPGVYPEITREVLEGQSMPGSGWGHSPPEEQARRSVYIHVKRSLIVPLLSTFDFPETDASCAARFATTQPAQAFSMLNSKFIEEQSRFLAERLRKEAGDEPAAQVTWALKLATSREPSPAAVQRGLALMQSLEKKHGVSGEKALAYYCLVVLNLNEFVYLD